jgi:hypothetical protein
MTKLYMALEFHQYDLTFERPCSKHARSRQRSTKNYRCEGALVMTEVRVDGGSLPQSCLWRGNAALKTRLFERLRLQIACDCDVLVSFCS